MGTIQIDGSTPKLTIGNAIAEDATILFDGNAQDFYIALDDSADNLLIGLGSTVGTTPAIAIDENLKVNIPVTTASTSASTGSLTTGGGAGIGADLYVGDDVYLITDSAVLGFGADKDTTLTHTDGTGLTLNSTNKLCFNDASQYIQGASNAILDIAATDEIELTATLVDVNANLDVSGTYTGAGLMTTGGNIVIPNAGNIGSASDTDAIAIASNGVTTFSQAPVFPDGSLALADLDIDGGTDIGAAIVDADLFIVDDGAGGTNRKVTASRLKTYTAGLFGTVGFSARLVSGSVALADVTTTDIVFESEVFDSNSAYNVSSGEFTVPVAGKYMFGVNLVFADAQGNMSDMIGYLSMDGTAVEILRGESTSNATTHTKVSRNWIGIVASLDVDDVVKVQAQADTNDSSSSEILHGDYKSHFWGVNLA